MVYACVILLLGTGLIAVVVGGKDDRFIEHLKKSEMNWIHNYHDMLKRLNETKVEALVLKSLLDKLEPPAKKSRPPKLPKPKPKFNV